MTWFRVDDTFAAHPKPRRAGLAAIGLWTVAGSWSSQQLTEGFIPEWFVDTWPQGRKLAGRLVAAGLWSVATQDGEKGWLFHQWTDANPTAEKERKRRAAARDRQKRAREKAAEERERRRDAALADPHLSRVTGDVTERVTDAVSHAPPYPSLPDPTRPSVPTGQKPRTTSGGNLAEADARRTPPAFPDHCPEHAYTAIPPPCGRCKETREHHATEPAPDYRLRVVQPLCGQCDDRWINTPDGYAHCPRCHPAEVRTA